MDDGLLLLVQKRDELPLGGDVAPDASVSMAEKPDDSRLFARRGDRYTKSAKLLSREMRNGRLVIDSVEPARRRDRAHDVLQVVIPTLVDGSHTMERVLDDAAF